MYVCMYVCMTVVHNVILCIHTENSNKKWIYIQAYCTYMHSVAFHYTQTKYATNDPLHHYNNCFSYLTLYW